MSLTITSPEACSQVRATHAANTGLVDIVSGSFGAGHDVDQPGKSRNASRLAGTRRRSSTRGNRLVDT